ncbi:thaumatin [Halteromyces radiatus]|uniref:thaumatin n=1 Tax=Halteromyces radiatus TaxID=101107 RepID=UPI002220B924|nr:thaumatin [Halteromyces radiatus]KAI8089283.1 thaumatin [Halteromyces radiatus]
MYFSPLVLSCAFLGGLVAGLPVNNTSSYSGNNPFVVVKNQCSYSIVAGTSENGNQYGQSVSVSAGGSHTFNYNAPWEGRIWARKNCSGKTCNFSGMWAPTSLAEFHFASGTTEDFYDISFVDGWNLPLSIAPNTKSSNSYQVDKHCGTPSVKTLPDCPQGFQTDDGACQSACSHFQTPEYCCTGAYNSADTCKASSYAAKVKAQAPDAYSYAFDDATSVYTCKSQGYTVTFCP